MNLYNVTSQINLATATIIEYMKEPKMLEGDQILMLRRAISTLAAEATGMYPPEEEGNFCACGKKLAGT